MRVSEFFRPNLQILVIGLAVMFLLNMFFPMTDETVNSNKLTFTIVLWGTMGVFATFGLIIAFASIPNGKEKYVFMHSAVGIIGVSYAIYDYGANESSILLSTIIMSICSFLAVFLLLLHAFCPDYMERRYHGNNNF